MWKRGLSTAILTVLFGVGIGQAHFIWIERDNEGPARVYFGEWADDTRCKHLPCIEWVNGESSGR